MKRYKLFAIFVLAVIALFSLGACQNTLDTPQDLEINLDLLQLSWAKVPEATRYVIQITNVDTGDVKTKTTRSTRLSLDGILAEGDYDISVMAEGGDAIGQSEWSTPISYHQDYVSGCVYELINNNSEYAIQTMGMAKGEIYIEDFYRGKPVTTIKASAFRTGTSITKVVIGNNVTTIQENAFYGCSRLTNVVLPESLVTLGNSAFQNCHELAEINIPSKLTALPAYMFAQCRKLKSITIPDTVETIGEYAFTNCYSLESIVIPDNVTELGKGVFFKCEELKEITIGKNIKTLPEELLYGCYNLTTVNFAEGNKLETLEDSVFASCYVRKTINQETQETVEIGLKALTLPETVVSIGRYCFQGSKLLETINIPDSVTSIGREAFVGTKIYEDQINSDEGLVYIGNWLVGIAKGYTEIVGDQVVVVPDVYELLTDLVRAGEDPVEDIEAGKYQRKLREDIVGIADRVFRQAPNLKSVYLPASLKYVGKNAFARCEALYRVRSEGENLVSLGDDAFGYCISLYDVRFNEGLKTIGARVYQGCEQLQDSETYPLIPKTVETVGTVAFKDSGIWNDAHNGIDAYATEVIIVSNWIVGYVGMYAQDDSERVDLGSQDVSEYDIIGISDYALYGATSLLQLTGVSGARNIGYGAFYMCQGLNTIALNSNLKTIEDYAFYGCVSMTQVSFPTAIKSIGRASFYACQQLTSLDFSRCTQLESIGMNAFYGCVNLASVDFGTRSVLQTIGEQAFYRCATGKTEADSGLKEIVLPETVTSIGKRSFGDCYLLEKVQFSPLLTEIAPYAFRNCTSLKSITIPSTIKTVGEYAFSKTGLEEVVFEEGVETIAKYAFYEAKAINSITFSNTITSIGKYGFKGCRELRTLILPQTITSIDAHAFYGCKGMTIYTDASQDLEGWHLRWNSSYRPIFYNSTFSQDNSYVVSVNLKEGGYKNIKDFALVVLPERDGYVATGWDKAIPETIPAEGIVLTVNWTEGYSIKYNLNGGIANGTNPYAYYEGSAEIVLTTPTKSERVLNEETGNLEEVVYVFDGWYDNEGNKITSIPTGSSGDIELTAKWLHPDEVPEEPVEPENPENPEG